MDRLLKRIVRFLVERLCRIVGFDTRSFTAAGYEEAIAGSKLAGATDVGARSYSVELAIQEAERQRLSELLRTFAARHGLRFFDYQQKSKRFSLRRMALFSPKGLHIHADMIIGNSRPAKRNMQESPMMLVGVTFANHDDWQSLFRDLDTTLRRQWPDKTGPERLGQVEPINVPDFDSWKKLSPEERSDLQAGYSYREEAAPLMQAVVDDFRKEFGSMKGLKIDNAPAIYHGGSWVINVTHPFIFDRRQLPKEHFGVWVHAGINESLPPEFATQRHPGAYAWAPPNYERFVDRCGDEIRQAWGKPDMPRAEILEALVGRPFDEHLAHCREQVRQGKLPQFE